MSQKSIIYDATGQVDITFTCRANHGIIFYLELVPNLENETVTLDTGYTLTLGDKTYTVGNGLTLANGTTILWHKPSTDFVESGETATGFLISDSNEAPTAIKWCVNIEVI